MAIISQKQTLATVNFLKVVQIVFTKIQNFTVPQNPSPPLDG